MALELPQKLKGLDHFGPDQKEKFKILEFDVASCRLCRFRSKKAILEVARQICKSKAGVFAC